MSEEWRDIPGLPKRYQVSNHGRIKTLAHTDRRGWNRKELIMASKNAEISLITNEGKQKWFPVAALVLKAFIGDPPPNCYMARHLDDNRENNHLENLAWGNDADNHADAIKNGRSYISYGHLGKPHSEETKLKLRMIKKGKPTGHKMTEEHKQAMLAGYRKRFPEKPHEF